VQQQKSTNPFSPEYLGENNKSSYLVTPQICGAQKKPPTDPFSIIFEKDPNERETKNVDNGTLKAAEDCSNFNLLK